MRKFDCPKCGGGLALRAEGATRRLYCQYCGAALDPRDPRQVLVEAYDSKLAGVKPTIPLGARGTLKGELLEVVGWQRRAVRYYGVDYEWSEYLLWNPYRGFRWLTESNGHWLLLKPVPGEPEAAR